MRRVAGLIPALIALLSSGAHAQDEDAQALAKQLANPIASLVSVPFQFNWDGGYGPQDGDRAFVNIQPVIPVSVSEDWNLISRTILPVNWQNDIAPGAGTEFGLGDTVQSLFFSPKESAGWIWGVGPVFLLPTATEDTMGAEKWGAGPTGVALQQTGPWTYGALANHVWSFAGSGDSEVNATFLQPFLNYTTPGATTFYLNTESTYDWTGGDWSVPINAGVNQLFAIGSQKIQLGGGVRYWATAPDAGPEGWGVRVNLVFLFPK